MSIRVNQEGLNVRDFGAKADGTTDDSAAINAVIASFSATNQGGKVFLPRGNYRLASPIRLTRQVVLEGEAGSGWYGSTWLKPDKGVAGIIVDANSSHPGMLGGPWSVIRNLNIQGQGSWTTWAPTHAYTAGDIVVALANLNYRCVFVCTGSGTSGGSEPAWANYGEDVPGITDGSVTWVSRIVSGVRFHGRAKVENVYITGMASNGLHVVADTSQGRTANVGGLVRTGGNTVTVTTTAPHLWGTGRVITLVSTDPDFVAGNYAITVTGTNTFTYINSGANVASAQSVTMNSSTNANGWRASYMRIDGFGLNGIYVQGGDTNAGYVDAIDVGSTAGSQWCIYDSSFLGNTYSGCEVACDAGAIGSYHSDNANARNVFMGCYSEGGPASRIRAPAMVLGGLHGAGFTADSQGAFYESGKQTNTYSFQGNATDGFVRFGWGQQFDGINVWDVSAYDGAQAVLTGTTLRMKYIHSGGGAGFYRFDIDNLDATMPYAIATYQQSVYQPGTVAFGNGIALGAFGGGWNALFAGVHMAAGTAPPGSGTNAAGDLIINSSATGPIFWKCSVAGTPGTWVAYYAGAGAPPGDTLVVVATDQSPAAIATHTVYVNSSADVIINLPTSPTLGTTFGAHVVAAHHIKMLAGGANVIYNGTTAGSAGGYMDANAIGSTIELVWNGTYWFVTKINGSWSQS